MANKSKSVDNKSDAETENVEFRRENPTTGVPGDVVTPSGAPLRGDVTEEPDNKTVTAMPSSQEGSNPVAGVAELNKSNPPQQQTPGGNTEGTDFRSLEAQLKNPPLSAAQIVDDKKGLDKITAFAYTYHETVPDDTVIAGRAGDKTITVGNLVNLEDGGDDGYAVFDFIADFPNDTPDDHVVASNGGVKLTLGDFRDHIGRDALDQNHKAEAETAKAREDRQAAEAERIEDEKRERGLL